MTSRRTNFGARRASENQAVIILKPALGGDLALFIFKKQEGHGQLLQNRTLVDF